MTKEELLIWRRSRNLTQTALGQLVGRSRQAVMAWESGKTALPADLLVKLEGASPSATPQAPARRAAMPAFGRWRVYPLGREDMTARETDRAPKGFKVWLQRKPSDVWDMHVHLGGGQYGHRNLDRLTLPPDAFPDPDGPAAPWVAEALDERIKIADAAQAERMQRWQAIGIPPEEGN